MTTSHAVAASIANKIVAATAELNTYLAMAARVGLEVELLAGPEPLVPVTHELQIPVNGEPDADTWDGPTYTAYEFHIRMRLA